VDGKIQKNRASISKTSRGKNNVYAKLGEEIEGGRAKQTRWCIGCSTDDNIEGRRCGVNGGRE